MPTQNSEDNRPVSDILAFGAHPDDIEFGCGAVIAKETQAGKSAHFVVCSKGEAGTSGTAEQRAEESRAAAALLGATIEFIDLNGDSHLEIRAAHAIKLAQIIRQVHPRTVLATSCVDNQHPDHARLGQLVRDAARMARYAGLKELLDFKTHEIEQLFFYAVTPDGEPRDETPILIDVSQPQVMAAWTAAMGAHVSQGATRNYIDLQLTRAKLLGTRARVEFAIPLFSNEPLLFDSVSQAGRGVRNF
ncbi:MAG: PIG-L family deacetylase [Cyanobacteria bacterium SZAS LIN-2]|nr:PIG-L family deacetylase [Cyanobacteria bacterium SZAS LIN-2]